MLIIVVWMIALLAVVSGAYMRSVQAHARTALGRVQSARAELVADSGFSLAVLDLIESRLVADRDRRFPANGRPVACQLDPTAHVTVSVQDAGGRINLNTASERLLTAVFLGLGASREEASRRADTLLDYRDADDNRRVNGAEQPEYVAAGRRLGPKNAPLDSLEELTQVLGFDAELIEQIEPHVTIHSGTAGLDPAAVSPALAAIVRRGAEGLTAASRTTGETGGLPAEFIVSSTRRVYLVTAAGHVTGAASFVREAVVELLSNRDGSPIIKMWRRASHAHDELSLQGGQPPPQC